MNLKKVRVDIVIKLKNKTALMLEVYLPKYSKSATTKNAAKQVPKNRITPLIS